MGNVIDDHLVLVVESIDDNIAGDRYQGIGNRKTEHAEDGQGQPSLVGPDIIEQPFIDVHENGQCNIFIDTPQGYLLGLGTA